MANNEKKYNAREFNKKYIASVYTAENIQKAGGIDNFNKAIKKFKRHERILSLKDFVWMLFHCYLPLIAIPVGIILLIIKLFF